MPRRTGRVIDFKSWLGIPSISLTLTASTTVIGASLAFQGPATILRCRGRLLFHLDETQQASDEVKIGCGLGIVSTDAFTLGATAMPDPSGDPEFPWLWWDELTFSSSLAAAEETFGSTTREVIVDTKAMRKIKPAESLGWVFQYTDITGTPLVDLNVSQTRVLVGV